MNSGGLQPATMIPGFPTDSFVAFALAIPFIQGALFATMNAGTDLARDIQTGFLNRLALTPLRGRGLIVGQLAGVAVVAMLQAVALPRRRLRDRRPPRRRARPAWSFCSRSRSRSRSASARSASSWRCAPARASRCRGSSRVLFVFLLISSMNFPRNLIEVDWFRVLATVNPVSYLIEGVRSLIIEGWNAEALALAFAISAVLLASPSVAATLALRGRMTRT